MITIKKALEIIKNSKNIAIFAHNQPDPDACGSMFGLQDLCQKLGKKADVFIGDVPAEYISGLFPFKNAEYEFHADKYDLVVITDMHAVDRLNPIYEKKVQNFKNILIVDHHALSENESLMTENCIINETAAAASMIIADFFIEAEVKPSKEGATYLYAGIMGDTDRFLHNNLTPEVFDKAAYLMKCGAEIQAVYDVFYRKITKQSIKTQKALYNRLRFINKGKVAYAIFTNVSLRWQGIDIEDIKAFSNELVRVEGVELSFLIYPLPDGAYKVSMRSVNADLRPFSIKMGGGGHKYAAAFTFENNVVSIWRNVKVWAKEILNG